MLFTKEVLDYLRLLLTAEEMAPHGRHHFGAILRPTLAQRVSFDILIQQVIRIKFGLLAWELYQSKVGRVLGHEVFRQPPRRQLCR